MAHHAYLLKRRSENEAELAKRRAEAERQVRERRIKVQQERRDRLLGQANAWRMAQDIRSFVANVLQGRGDPGAELRSWVNWAHAEADALDPTLNGSLTPADITPADDPSSRVEAPARGCAAGYDQGSRS